MLRTPLNQQNGDFNGPLTSGPNDHITVPFQMIQKISENDSQESDNLPFFQMRFSYILKDFAKLMRVSLLISFSFFSNLILLMINLHFVSRFQDPTLIGAIGLGNVWINSLGINTIYGLNYGFEILASKAYGASNYPLVGLYFKKGVILDSLIFVVFCLFSLFTEKIFIALGQSAEVSLHLHEYVVNTLPGLYFAGLFDLRAIYFNAQEVFMAPVIIQIFTTISHYFWCTLFFDYHIKGIAYAMDLSLFINFILLEIYNFAWSPRKFSYVAWSKDVLNNFWDYMKLTIPIGMTTVLEEFSYEVNSIIAGLMSPTTILAAHVTLANVGALFYCLPEGFATGINTYVGISLGEKKEHKAKRNAIMGFIGSIFVMLISYLILWLTLDYWVFLLIDIEEVIYLIKKTFYLFALVGFLDTIQLSIGAVVKVTGRGNLALLMYLICLYILANPLSYLFGITIDLGLEGIWDGIVIGLALLGVFFLIIALRIDWKKEIEMVDFNEDVQELMGNIAL